MDKFPKFMFIKNPNPFSHLFEIPISSVTNNKQADYQGYYCVDLRFWRWIILAAQARLITGGLIQKAIGKLCRKLFKRCLCLRSVMDYGGARGNHLKVKAGASKQKHVEFRIGSTNQDSSDTLSSFSSDSSSDDFFQVNPQILPTLRSQNKPPQYNGPTKTFYKNDEIDVSSEALYRLEESIVSSPGSTSQFSDITHESLMPQFSPTMSPQIQVMERFDPDRIPASVFSKSSTPTEWSVASNDSLFSIRIGNSSFSRDHISRIEVDLPKPGELPKSLEILKSGELSQSGETYESKELPKTGEIHKSSESYQPRENFKVNDLKRPEKSVRFRPTSPTIIGIEPNKTFNIENAIVEDVKPDETRTVDEPVNDGPKDSVNNKVVTVVRESRYSSGANRQYDRSETRVQSFAKPIKKKSSHQLCHCTDCYQALCGCKCLACSCKWFSWPSCSLKCFTWPSCSGNCLKCPSCHCKCLNFSSCCCKCPNLSSCSCKCPNLLSYCCKCPNLSSCCCKYPNWSSCCCKCPNWSSCCGNCSSLSCCKCSSWSCCKCSSWSCCKCSSGSCFKCSSCSCFKCSSWSCFKCSSCSCFKCSSCSCFKCSSCSCFKCSSWSCCKCPSWPSCKCRCSICSWACCNCWKREPKRSSMVLTNGGITNSKGPTKASSRRKCSCFSCSSSCSCCSCWSCSCCC